ncbi:MAG: formate/nitrite transporter family protein [Eubacteriaceae bacterium]|nr:formate/nitrite transporter family protein [Eubacteriaceae bacterium]
MKQLKPAEILEQTINAAVIKADGGFKKLFFLGIMAGAFIALGGAAANMCSYYFLSNPATAGIGRMISGLIFPAGLVMVVLAGGELFTGNCMMTAALIDKRISFKGMIRNWIIVYVSNFIGGALIAWMFVYSGLLGTGEGLLETVTINSAAAKVSLPWGQAFIRGILCNVLVCIAVWIGTGADSTVGKIFGMFFPIWAFVAAGYEHSVANMYFVSAGLFADGGSTAGLTWPAFLTDNLVPVTLGNIIGGGIFVAAVYYFALKEKKK